MTHYTIEVLSESNLESLIRMKEQFRWNQTDNDLKRLLRLNRHGNFAAYDGNRMIGTITTMLYGTELAWIGMMMVDRGYRRRGIAKSLLTRALEYLRRVGVDNIRLDATPEGLPLYETMGFVPESTIERWEYSAKSDLHGDAHPFEKMFLPAIMKLDKTAFGADRSMLLQSLLEESDPSSHSLICTSPSTKAIDGYAFARTGSNAYYIGPVVARNAESALSLLEGMLSQVRNQNVWFDFNKSFRFPADYFPRHGFVHQRNLTRMSLNAKPMNGSSQLVFAIAGPELG
jgi:GNAT superfamily N-acetyltransferase